MPRLDNDASIATILKHDNKTTSYKIALLRALNDLVLSYPGLAQYEQPVAVPLVRIAELWAAYYWPFMDEHQPIYQGARALRDGALRNDVSFRPALTQLRTEWRQLLLTVTEPADGYFLLTEMHTPRRRATYPASLVQAYIQALAALVMAIKMPIQYAGPKQWSIFPKPAPLSQFPPNALPIPGTLPTDLCVLVTAPLWHEFHRLSLYIEALCIHEWSLFTEGVTQEPANIVTRGTTYTLLTARPDNRRPLSWERNQVDLLLLEQVPIFCPWTGKPITQPAHYDLDHLLPLKIYPINELWNLLPVDKAFNQHTKRDRIPDAAKLLAAQPRVAAAYTAYHQSTKLLAAIHEDAALRFTGLTPGPTFAASLARHALAFIDSVAIARFATRF